MKYLIRLDDASDHLDVDKWQKMESLLDEYGIKPIFGIIPDNKDESLISQYEKDVLFWDKVRNWIKKGWIPAMHGYEHKYVTRCGGMNPINPRSEFAGLSLKEQSDKIRKGYHILQEKGITPEIFFAPSHTFDMNTLKALKQESPIRIVSDTFAWDVYRENDIWFIPQQCGMARKLPFKTVTFCYHPNTMNSRKFEDLGRFLKAERKLFVEYDKSLFNERKKTFLDSTLQGLYLISHKIITMVK